MTATTPRAPFIRKTALVAVAATAAYLALRFYWASGWRLGHTACRPGESDPAALANGCGAADVGPLGFWPGWGAVMLAALAVGVATIALIRPRRTVDIGLWAATGALVVLSFPGHLVFQIPAGLAGRPTDWRDVAHRLVQLAVALLLAWVAVGLAKSRRCGHPRTSGREPVARWVRWSAYAGCAVPILGFSLPHLLWFVGIEFGASAATIAEVRAAVDVPTAVALCGVPAMGGLLTLGLGMRWGRIVPRVFALAPAAVVSAALVAYGVIGVALMVRDFTFAELAEQWALYGTELVFLAWGLALSTATWGYHLATRKRCGTCERAGDEPSPALSATTTSPA